MKNIYIITGLSGSGKSTVMKVLEDKDFYCIDNIPPLLVISFCNMSNCFLDLPSNIAFGIDARSENFLLDLSQLLEYFKNNTLVKLKLIFIDANTNILIKRYKETRRRHPLFTTLNDDIEILFKKERCLLDYAKKNADIIVDTTTFSIKDLKNYIYERVIFDTDCLSVHICSFGFKFGIPIGADIVFDVRCLANPYYIDELKQKTGLDESVRDYVMDREESIILFDKLKDLILFSLPLYQKEGKTQFEIAIGCTGGKHRSVTFTELLYEEIKKNGFDVSKLHRDIDKKV